MDGHLGYRCIASAHEYRDARYVNLRVAYALFVMHNRITYSMKHMKSSYKDEFNVFINTLGITSYKIASRVYFQELLHDVSMPYNYC
jgi:hypothetical protein